MKAIETEYAGCRFRSRLEARWAVFFDAARIAWEYEPEGFELADGTRYLPDFRLTACGTWIEVKGSVDQLDAGKLEGFVEQAPPGRGEMSGVALLMLLGPIPEPHDNDWSWRALVRSAAPGLGYSFYGFGSYLKNDRPWWHDFSRGWDSDDEDLLLPLLTEYEPGLPHAYRAARSARFEHGERVLSPLEQIIVRS